MRAALIAIQDAVDCIAAEYEREEEVRPWLNDLIHDRPKGTSGTTADELLRKIRDRFRMSADQSDPKVQAAIQAISAAMTP